MVKHAKTLCEDELECLLDIPKKKKDELTNSVFESEQILSDDQNDDL